MGWLSWPAGRGIGPPARMAGSIVNMSRDCSWRDFSGWPCVMGSPWWVGSSVVGTVLLMSLVSWVVGLRVVIGGGDIAKLDDHPGAGGSVGCLVGGFVDSDVFKPHPAG